MDNLASRQRGHAERLRKLGLRTGADGSSTFPGYFGAGYRITGDRYNITGPYTINPKSASYGGNGETEKDFITSYDGPGLINKNFRLAISANGTYGGDTLISFTGAGGSVSILSGAVGLESQVERLWILGGGERVEDAAAIGITGDPLTDDPGGIGGWGKHGKVSHADWDLVVGDDLSFAVPRAGGYTVHIGYPQSFLDWWEAEHQTDEFGNPIPAPEPPDDPGQYWPPPIEVEIIELLFGQVAGNDFTSSQSSEVAFLEPIWESPGFTTEVPIEPIEGTFGTVVNFPEDGGGWYKFVAGGSTPLLGKYLTGDFSGIQWNIGISYGDPGDPTFESKDIDVSSGFIFGGPAEVAAGQVSGMFWVPDHVSPDIVKASIVASPKSQITTGAPPNYDDNPVMTGISTDMMYESAYFHMWRLFRDGTE